MSARTITGELKAYVTDHSSVGPEELTTLNGQKLVAGLFYTANDMSASGWTLVGTAKLTVELTSNKKIIEGQVTALKAKKRQVIAEAEREATSIERQIQQLLAIELSPGGAA